MVVPVTPDHPNDNRFAVIDVVDRGRTVHEYGLPGTRCDPVAWLDPGSFLAYCTDVDYLDLETVAAARPAWYRVDVDGKLVDHDPARTR